MQNWFRLVHITGADDRVVNVNVLSAYQQGNKGAAKGTAVCCENFPSKFLLNVLLHLLYLVQFRKKGSVLRFIKSAVADDSYIKMFLQILKNMPEICFPVTAGSRKQQDHRLILGVRFS